MKKYTIKNYKGNLVESLSKFQKSHKGMRIVEAVEDKDGLKIKVTEAIKKSYVLCHGVSKGDHGSGIEVLKADIPSKKELKKEMIKFYVDGGEMEEDEIKEAFSDGSFAPTEIDDETGWDEWKISPEFKSKLKKYADLVDSGKAKFFVVDNEDGYYEDDPLSFFEISNNSGSLKEAAGSRFNFGRGGISLDKFDKKDKLYTIFYCGYDDGGSYYVNCGENLDQQEFTKKLKKELSKLKKSYYVANRGPLENDEYEIYTTNEIVQPLGRSMSLKQMLKYQKFRKIFSDDLLKKIDAELENEALSLYAVEALFGEGNFYIIELDK